MKNLLKAISLMLVFTLSVNFMPMVAFAEVKPEKETSNSFGNIMEKTIKVAEAPKNIQALLNDENNQQEQESDIILPGETPFDIRTKHLNNNYTLEVYGTPVRYKDNNGDLQFIDTSMKSFGFIDRLTNDYDYKNSANAFTVNYSKDAEKGLKMNGDFTMAAKHDAVSKCKNAVIDIDKNSDGRLTYPKAFGENTYLEYINVSSGVKENIIVEKNIGKNRFEFTWYSETHTPILSEDGTSIQIVKKDNPQQVDYVITPLYVYDSYTNNNGENSSNKTIVDQKNEPVSQINSESTLPLNSPSIAENTSLEYAEMDSSEVADSNSAQKEATTEAPIKHFTEDCHYELAQQKEGYYIITAVVSEDFLNRPETVYPVTIDPSITATMSTTNINDTYVNQSSPTTNYGNITYMRFGYLSGKMFGYVKFNTLPSSINANQINSANLKLTFRTGTTTSYEGKMYRVAASSWSETGLTWNNQPYGYDCGVVSDHHNCTYYQFDTTNLVKGWYNGTYPNYGVDFTYSNETYNDYNSVYSAEGSTASAPKLTINYGVRTTYINPGQASANSSYNRDTAAQYAEDYGDYESTSTYDTPDYYSTANSWGSGDGNNCTNFVSQCLHTGGMIYLGSNSTRTQDSTWLYDTLLFKYYASYTWGGAPNFARHWGHDPNGNGQQRAYMTVIYPSAQDALDDWNYIFQTFWHGDVIQTATDNGVNHTMIITDPYNMLYAQHTGNAIDVSLYDKLVEYATNNSTTDFIFYKIK